MACIDMKCYIHVHIHQLLSRRVHRPPKGDPRRGILPTNHLKFMLRSFKLTLNSCLGHLNLYFPRIPLGVGARSDFCWGQRRRTTRCARLRVRCGARRRDSPRRRLTMQRVRAMCDSGGYDMGDMRDPSHAVREARCSACVRGNHLSNTTCLTHVFFEVVNNAANSISRIKHVLPQRTNEAALDEERQTSSATQLYDSDTVRHRFGQYEYAQSFY